MKDCNKCEYRRDDNPFEYCAKGLVWCEDEVEIKMPYSDFLSKIENVLRESIVVWEEEEYKDIARKIAEKLSE